MSSRGNKGYIPKNIAKYVPKGCNIAFKILNKEMSKGDNSKFLVYYDPDIDGLMSGFIAQRFLSKFHKDSIFYINENREHGFKIPEDLYPHLKGMTILAVDFSMSREEIKHVLSLGANIVNIDHHNIDDDFIYEKDEVTGCEGVVINNQYPWEPEDFRFLSGAGVVHYVFRYILEKLGITELDLDEVALVGISLLSDVRPTENRIAQDFLMVTFNHESELTAYLVNVVTPNNGFERFDSFGVPRFNRNFIDFVFSPHLNALFRLNRGKDAILLVRGDRMAIETYKIGGLLASCKDLQNNITEQILLGLKGNEYDNIIVKGLDNKFKLNSNHNISNFIGLACSRVRGDNKTTFLFVEGEKDGFIKRGSVRGLYDNVDYLSIFRAHGLKAEGHKNAFGVLETDITTIDFKALDKAIGEAEEEARNGVSTSTILRVANIPMFLQGPNKQIALQNTMVRDSHRIYLKYTGDDIKKEQRGRMIKYTIDGIPVNCFDLDLTVEEGLILPMYGKGDYIEFTLKRDFTKKKE